MDFQENTVISNVSFDVVGSRPIRHDGSDKVTGLARYGADIYPTNYIHGKVLRSPYAHAKIISIDIKNTTTIEIKNFPWRRKSNITITT